MAEHISGNLVNSYGNTWSVNILLSRNVSLALTDHCQYSYCKSFLSKCICCSVLGSYFWYGSRAEHFHTFKYEVRYWFLAETGFLYSLPQPRLLTCLCNRKLWYFIECDVNTNSVCSVLCWGIVWFSVNKLSRSIVCFGINKLSKSNALGTRLNMIS